MKAKSMIYPTYRMIDNLMSIILLFMATPVIYLISPILFYIFTSSLGTFYFIRLWAFALIVSTRLGDRLDEYVRRWRVYSGR